MRRLSLSLIGGFSLRHGDRAIAIRNRKAEMLLAYLALSQNRHQTREQLAGLLWSNVPEQNARGSLRQTLRHLKRVLEELGWSGLQISRHDVSLESSGLSVDVWNVIDAAERGTPNPILLNKIRITEELLKGYEDIDQAVRSWLIVQRQILFERIVFLLESRITFSDESSTSPQSTLMRECAISLLNIDPTHEEACRHLMLTYARAGDMPKALSRYNALYDLLDREYDTEPSVKTQNLVVRIKSGDFEAPQFDPQYRNQQFTALNSSPTSAGRRSARWHQLTLRIGAFRSSVEGEGELQSDRWDVMTGFRHQLISNLVRFREWSVVDASAGDLACSSSPPDQVLYSIEATSFRVKNKLRLILTASDQNEREYVWSAEYSANSEKWLSEQTDVVRKIALALNIHLSADRIRKVIGEPDIALPIYDRWLKALNQARFWRPKNRVQAASMFRSIIGDAPNFAPAYCNLINFYNSVNQMFPGVHRTRENIGEAALLVKTAMGLEPANSKTQLCAAWSHAMQGQFDLAELGYQTAYDLNENDPWTLASSTLGLALCGQRDIALDRADQAVELGLTIEPLHWGYQVVTRFLCGDYKGALSVSDRAGDVAYSFVGWNVAALGRFGRTSEAQEKWAYFKNLIHKDWQGAEPFENVPIALWLLQTFPIRNRSDWKRLRDGLTVVDPSIGKISEFHRPRSLEKLLPR